MTQRRPRSPTRFVTARHLITHPEDTPTEIAKHCDLNLSSVGRARKALFEATNLDPMALVVEMQKAQEKPAWKTFHFRAPNPEQFLTASRFRSWMSGEYAAEADGLDLVPERLLVYVKEGALKHAMRTAQDIVARSAPAGKANLTIRVADPWLWLDEEARLVERGQRLFDYAESKHVQLLWRWRDSF